MFLMIFLFGLGVVVGFCFLAMIALGKQADMMEAIKNSAYKNNSNYCRKFLEEQR